MTRYTNLDFVREVHQGGGLEIVTIWRTFARGSNDCSGRSTRSGASVCTDITEQPRQGIRALSRDPGVEITLLDMGTASARQSECVLESQKAHQESRAKSKHDELDGEGIMEEAK